MTCTGGWNNNPNATQFQYVFRRLLTRCGVQPGATGNVVALDNTCFVQASTAEHAGRLDDEASSPFEDTHDTIADYDYSSPALSSLVQHITVYIAGWVVRKAMKSLTCDKCRGSLVSAQSPQDFAAAYHLLTLKNNGGLVVPSEGCVKVLLAAEKTVRYLLNTHRGQNKVTTQQVVTAVCAAVGANDIFLLGQHIVDTQYGIDNHHYLLMRLIVNIYVSLRQHHIAKLHTLRMHRSNIRSKLTKTILFKGQ